MRISDWSSDVCSSDLFGIVADRQRASVRLGVIAGVEAEPVFAVGAGAGGIARPAVGIGRCAKPRDRDFQRVADRARHTEVEPLEKIRLAILANRQRSEEHTSELQSLMRISYAVFCLQKKKKTSDR